MSGPTDSQYRWRFVRAGGFDQVCLDRGEDIKALDQLDQKLWVALSCPTRGLEFDQATLDLIDTDNDGRIRAPELLAAVRWSCAMLKDPETLLGGSPTLALSAINDGNPDGAKILASARQILLNLGKTEDETIAVDDLADVTKIFAGTRFNGDGIVPVHAAEDEALQQVISEIITCLGPETDRSGAEGVSLATVDRFIAEAQAYSDWHAVSEGDPATILPLGEATAAAIGTFKAVRAKIDDFFSRCRLAAFDPRSVGALNRDAAEYVTMAQVELSASGQEVAGFPLAMVEAGKDLPLADGINPGWAAAIAKFRSEVVVPLFGAQESLSEAQWADLSGRFAAHEAWLAAKPATTVDGLGLARLREILASGSREAIAGLVAKDLEFTEQADAIGSVAKLVRYNRDLVQLINNFVTFRDFYSRKDKAVFQAGTLFLDTRSCDLCLKVTDPGKHGALAGLSRAYLAYCDCVRPADNAKMTIVAAFTGGDSDYLMVGRNGIFYDRQGRDWDATITKVVENPISICQAFWSPYKKIARFIGEQIEKFASSKEKSVEASATASVSEVGKKVESVPVKGASAGQQAFDLGKFVGIFAAIGLALGAIGSAVAAMVTGLFKLAWWQIPLAFLGVILVISVPSMVIAWLKLRQRNLGPILDASGWAVNARARINIPFGGSLTSEAKLPPGTKRLLNDPYAEKSNASLYILLLAVAVAVLGFLWYRGIL